MLPFFVGAAFSQAVNETRPCWHTPPYGEGLSRPKCAAIRRRCGVRHRVVAFHLAMLFWVPVFAIIYLVLDAPLSTNIVFSAGVGLIGSLLLLRRSRSPELHGNIICLLGTLTYTSLAFFNGGPESPAVMWFVSLPIMSLLLCGPSAALFWTATSVAIVSGFALGREVGFVFPNESSPFAYRFLYFTGTTGLIACIYILASVFKRVENAALEALHAARFAPNAPIGPRANSWPT